MRGAPLMKWLEIHRKIKWFSWKVCPEKLARHLLYLTATRIFQKKKTKLLLDKVEKIHQ